jgi:hypothetical protein
LVRKSSIPVLLRARRQTFSDVDLEFSARAHALLVSTGSVVVNQ